ncbi:glycosyltransferase family 2 protein [Mycolicibacterium sp.]|uniref:glycosyltransferase family 2 protein n=1 Tax=Mycolicibacterium sp. TaxID=2320850 RepID=UPI0028B21E71|nr:glycosyltransferase family 2 protein [Mycolicibacterium sp.]
MDSLPSFTPSCPRVSVVIPVLNEERNLPYVAARMPGDVHEVIVVDGRSVDGTVQKARELWPNGIHLTQSRSGKGNALACGFAAATGDIVVMIDADCSTDPAEIPAFVGALIAGADFAKGSRFVLGGGSADITPLRKFGNGALSALVNALFGTKYSDLCYGYNAFWRHSLDAMRLPDHTQSASAWGDGFEIEALINVRIAASNLTVAEVASFERDRIHGQSNLNVVRDGLRILKIVLQEYAVVRKAGISRDGRPRMTIRLRSGSSERARLAGVSGFKTS